MGLLDMSPENAQALMAMGFAMMGAPRGREMQQFGQAGLLGMAAKQNYLDEIAKRQRADVVTEQEKLNLEQLRRQMAADAAAREYYAKNGPGGAPAALGSTQPPGMPPSTMPAPMTPPALSYGMQDRGMGAAPPVPMAPPQQVPSGAAPSQRQVLESMAQQRMIDAQNLAARGAFAQADIARKEAVALYEKLNQFDKIKPEHYTPESLAQVSRSGNYAELVPYTKPPEAQPPVGKVNPSDFTPASVATFLSGGGKDYSVLVPIDKRAVTNVKTVLPPMETEYDKTAGRSRAEAYYALQKAGQAAVGGITQLNTLETLLKGVETSPLTPVGMKVSGIAKGVLGIEIDPTLPNKQAAETLIGKMVLAARSAGENGQVGMPGNMSDSDREFLLGMNPNLKQTAEGRALSIEVQRRLRRREAETAAMARTYAQKHGRWDEGFIQEMQTYADSHPMFADLAPQGTANTTAGTPKPAPGSKSIRDQADAILHGNR